MKTIWKYSLPAGQIQCEIAMPIGAQIVAFKMQNNIPCIWAIVESSDPLKKVQLILSVTGDKIPDATYIGTVQYSPEIVLHLFRQ